MDETGQKRGDNTPPEGQRFTADNQPPPENKKQGWERKKFSRTVIREMLDMPFKFKKDSQIRQQIIDSFGAEALKLNIGQIMSLQQMMKSIKKADTYAYTTVIDQALGKAVQSVAQTDNEGNNIPPFKMTPPEGMNYIFPDDIEGDEEPPTNEAKT